MLYFGRGCGNICVRLASCTEPKHMGTERHYETHLQLMLNKQNINKYMGVLMNPVMRYVSIVLHAYKSELQPAQAGRNQLTPKSNKSIVIK